MTNREGLPAVGFSWEGSDSADRTPLTGRGWAILRKRGRIEVGRQQDAGFVVRAVDDGGPVFENNRSRPLVEALAALERGWPSIPREKGSTFP